jgi:hypothetical protein
VSIIRVEHDREKPYTIIDNRTINDDRLSWDALGLLTWLLSKPDHWTVRAIALQSIRKAGKHLIKRLLKELEDAGYLTRNQIRAENGTWLLESVVREVSNQCGKPALVSRKSASQCGLTGTAEPAPDNPPLVSTELASTEIVNKNTELELNPFVRKKTGTIVVNAWDQFWNLYPKKTEKKAAAKAWQKLKPDLELQTTILARLKTFISTDWRGVEKGFIPNPATWLNDSKWENEIVIPPARNGHVQETGPDEIDRSWERYERHSRKTAAAEPR